MRWIVVGTLAAVAVMSAAVVGSQENLTVLRSDAFPRPQRPPVAFAHDAHNEKAGIDACSECHHVYLDGKRVDDESSEDKACSDCHALGDSGRRPGLMKAYHLNCKGCHQARKQGPVMCGECHARTGGTP
jgi:hypothetical protein